MSEYFDALETRDPEQRERTLMAALPLQVGHAMKNAPGFARILTGVDPSAVTSRAALATLPITCKSELKDLQQALPPLGGLNAIPIGKFKHLFVSPGQIYEPEGFSTDWWRSGRALFAAGVRAGDLAINTFSYHFTPAGSLMETGAHAIGCAVVPTGVSPQISMRVCPPA